MLEDRVVELIVSNHSKDCLSVFVITLELQRLCQELGVREDALLEKNCSNF